MPERAAFSLDREPLVLASGSPRRRWLLAKLGVRFEVLAVAIDETAGTGEAPRDFAQRMAEEKAVAAARQRPDASILAADTVVAVGDFTLGKPRDREDAVAMLRHLSGREHAVYTGVTLLRAGAAPGVRTVVETRVTFRALGAGEIDAYVATGEPFDRAGAYAIQGEGAHLVDRVAGSYTNVIGLPLAEVAPWLHQWRSI